MFFFRPTPSRSLGTPRAYFWNQALFKGINASKTADGQKHQALPFSQLIFTYTCQISCHFWGRPITSLTSGTSK